MKQADRDMSITTIRGWIPHGTETMLRRAATISADRGYNYLAEEHLLLAMLEQPTSYLARNWPEDGVRTLEQLREVLAVNMPPVQAAHIGPTGQVEVTTERYGPHANEIRSQIAEETD